MAKFTYTCTNCNTTEIFKTKQKTPKCKKCNKDLKKVKYG